MLELIATLLAGSPSTRLYRRLVVERELASTVDTQLTPFRDPSLLRIAVTLARGHRAEAALAEIDDIVRGLIETPVPAAELAKAKNLVETDFWAGLSDADGKAEALGHHETALGDFRSLTTLAERLAAVTADDVQRVAAAYLRRDRRSMVIAEPDPDAAPDDDDDDDDDDEDGDDALDGGSGASA